MPELAPVTRAFWPLRTLLIRGAGITASGRFSSRRCCCIRSSSCGDIGIRRLGGILISRVSFMIFNIIVVQLLLRAEWSELRELPYSVQYSVFSIQWSEVRSQRSVVGGRVPGGCRVQRRRQAETHSKRFATKTATVNEFRASVWSASSLLALFPAFIAHWDL